jgi:hypothetical protein
MPVSCMTLCSRLASALTITDLRLSIPRQVAQVTA